MDRKPVIGVIACTKPLEGETAQTVKTRYVEAISVYADAVPMIVPSLVPTHHAPTLIERLDGLLLTGASSNIAPRHYGSPVAGQGPFDASRDNAALALIEAAREAKKPIFGICRGFQEINVALGGTLADPRDTGRPANDHHADTEDLEDMFANAHPVDLAPGGALAQLFGARAIEVNSVHFQRLDRLGEGLRVEASATDGVVEAIASREADPLILAVQWHPEWQPPQRDHHLAFWQHVGARVRRAIAG